MAETEATRPRLRNRAVRTLISGLLALPYRWRVPLCGAIMSRIISPFAGYDVRVRDNLATIRPDLPEAEVLRLIRAVPDNFGRMLIEVYSGREFVAHAASHPVQGPGLAALDAAHAAKRPVVLVTGHIGNYEALRAALLARGFDVGVLYRPMGDPEFNDTYVAAMEQIGTKNFPRGRQGLGDMIRFLRKGGMLGLLIDQHMAHGAALTFFGRTAMTALSAADLALKYGALVVPVYGIRRPDGLDFYIVVEEPIPESTPEAMTQALNDSLERRVRDHMDQWLWIHRRWKGGQALEAAAAGRPAA